MENTSKRAPAGPAGHRRGRPGRAFVIVALAALGVAPCAFAQDIVVAAWLERTAAAARNLNYLGTILYQHGAHVETSRLVHWNDSGTEREKLVSLDGPAREVIRSGGVARCFYPEAKLIRIEPAAFRNAFPALSPAEQTALMANYDFGKAEKGRVAGLDAQAWVFQPKDGLRYGRKFWVDEATGLLLKARLTNEHGDVVEQFSFIDLTIGATIDSKMVKPTWSGTAPDWRMQNATMGEITPQDTGWSVGKVPPGFAKIAEGYRMLRERHDPVVHLVYSDGLVAVSVFIEKGGAMPPRPLGLSQQGGINVFVRPVDDRIVTVLGEVPGTTVRQMAYSVSHR
jgi:sigma-E factor negative regulatory protein RseB